MKPLADLRIVPFWVCLFAILMPGVGTRAEEDPTVIPAILEAAAVRQEKLARWRCEFDEQALFVEGTLTDSWGSKSSDPFPAADTRVKRQYRMAMDGAKLALHSSGPVPNASTHQFRRRQGVIVRIDEEVTERLTIEGRTTGQVNLLKHSLALKQGIFRPLYWHTRPLDDLTGGSDFKNLQVMSQSVTFQDEPCRIIRRLDGTREWWIAQGKGHQFVRFQRFDPDSKARIIDLTIRYRPQGDTWIPSGWMLKHYRLDPQGKPQLTSSSEVTVRSFQTGVEEPPETFRIENQPGDLVIDARGPKQLNLRYTAEGKLEPIPEK